MDLTSSFECFLRAFAPVFTEPSFATFRLMMTGWILSTRHRYVTDLIVSSDSVGNGHFSDYHRFFSQAVWDIDHLWKLLAELIVRRLVGKDAVIILSGDDTLCRKRGLGIFGTGMHMTRSVLPSPRGSAIGDTTGSTCVSLSSIPGGRRPKSFRFPSACDSIAIVKV